jgi:hypothetical protein
MQVESERTEVCFVLWLYQGRRRCGCRLGRGLSGCAGGAPKQEQRQRTAQRGTQVCAKPSLHLAGIVKVLPVAGFRKLF